MHQDEVIRIMCPNLGCQCVLAVPPRARGQVVRCRSCKTNIRVPAVTADQKPVDVRGGGRSSGRVA